MKTRGRGYLAAAMLVCLATGWTGSAASGLTIDQNGYVGIGTDIPNARLEVSGNAVLSGASQMMLQVTGSNTGGTWLNLKNQGGGGEWSIISTGSLNGEGAGKLLIKDDASGAVRLMFDGAGNIDFNGILRNNGAMAASGVVSGSNSATTGYGVYGNANATGNVMNYGGYFLSSGNTGAGAYGAATATGNIVNYGGKFFASGDQGVGVYGYASATGAVSNIGGYFIAWGDSGVGVIGTATGTQGKGVMGAGGAFDFYAAGSGTNYGPFTGSHEVKLSRDFPVELKPGFIVSVTGEVGKRLKSDGSVSVSSTLPTVRLSDKPNDKAVFGVFVQEAGLHEGHWYGKAEGERFGVVNALGEGRVWVTSGRGNIEAGDYITTSSEPGYGWRQDDDVVHSYTLGKATETVDWNSVTETVEIGGTPVKVYLIGVVFTSG